MVERLLDRVAESRACNIAGRAFIYGLALLALAGCVMGAVDSAWDLRDYMYDRGWFWRWLY